MTGHARDELIPKNNHAANTVIMVCHVTRFLLYQKFGSVHQHIDFQLQESELYQMHDPV